MEYRKNLYTCQDGIGRITMNYPKNLNAIDMDMVLELAALPLRVGGGALGRMGPGLGRTHLDLGGVVLSQGELIPPQGHLQRIPQGGDLGDFDLRSGGQTHVHQPPLYRARLVAHGQDHAALSGPQILERADRSIICLVHG